MKGDISELPEAEIQSSGYVIYTLEASLWCFLKNDSYPNAVLKAVNLGDDTDTTGAITGGLPALNYGYENIPEEWIESLAKRGKIENLAEKLKQKGNGR